jgi:hypothetical protein
MAKTTLPMSRACVYERLLILFWCLSTFEDSSGRSFLTVSPDRTVLMVAERRYHPWIGFRIIAFKFATYVPPCWLSRPTQIMAVLAYGNVAWVVLLDYPAATPTQKQFILSDRFSVHRHLHWLVVMDGGDVTEPQSAPRNAGSSSSTPILLFVATLGFYQ